VERTLKNNEQLQQLAIRRREEAIRDRTEDNQVLADLLGRVLRASPDLARLLLGGARLPSPFPKPGTGPKRPAKEFKGKRFPTFFHFDKHQAGEEHKRTAEVGRELRVAFVTDAQDDYFWRSEDKGSMRVTLREGDSQQGVSAAALNLRTGVARWTTDLPDDARVGDILTYDFVVTDPSRDEPFRNRLTVEVGAKSDRPSQSGRPTKRANSGDGEGRGDSGLALPDVLPVERDDWPNFGFDERSALLVRRQPGGEGVGGFDFFYNADNDSLLRAQKANPTDAVLTRERFRCALVLVGLALLQEDAAGARDASNKVEVEELISVTTRALAPVLLPLVEYVGTLSTVGE
jgi:hypothetical protein